MGELKTIVFVGGATFYRQFLEDEQQASGEQFATRAGYACSSTTRYVRYTGDACLRGMTGPAEMVTSTEPGLKRDTIARARQHVEIMNQATRAAREVSFYVQGRPAPQGSKIAGQGGSMREQSPYLRKWRADVKRACFAWYRDNGITPDALPWFPAGIAVELTVTFYVATDPTDPPDWDKLGRSTGDALTEGRAWADDGQVTDGHVRIRRADEHHPAGAFITIREATL